MAIINVFEDFMMMSGLVFWFVMLLEFIAEFIVPAIVTLMKKIIRVIYGMVTEIWNDIREYREYKRLRNYYYDFDEVLAEEAKEAKERK